MKPSEAGKLGYAKTGHILRQQMDDKQEQLIREYEAHPKFCKQCGELIPFEKRMNSFCNHTCSALFNNRGKARHFKHSKICANCGKEKQWRHNKYCPECIEKRVYNKKVSLEEAKNDRVRKRIILDERGWRCEVCDLAEWMGKPIPIELDHIDGNADNNSRENLRLICPNCHAQTETYKGANAGKGSKRQSMRRQRYADGKTY